MEGGNTKRKQKREIKKIEDKKDLQKTLAKRKCGIYKKASELTTLCGAKVDMLMFTSSGKWLSYGEPSHQANIRSSDEENDPTKDDINEPVEDHAKSKIDELCEKNKALIHQLHYEEERENKLVEIMKTRNTHGWWEAKIQDLNCEKAKELEASFVELKKKLENELSVKQGDNGKSSHGGVFTFYPYGERREDLFDIVYPPTNQARGHNLFVNDANASSNHTHVASSSKNSQENIPHLPNAI
ncbi:Agamous-like MADS-box protein AGL62 [Glycine max]|nr:Agamous-like MADS-box protein AGL62 [Glycine max]